MALPPSLQVAFLAACVEHVVSGAKQTDVIPVAVEHSVISLSLEIAWLFSSNRTLDSRASAVEEALDHAWQELDDGMQHDAQHLASASVMVVNGLPSPRKNAQNCLNHLDAFIDLVDPDPDSGIAEESGWRDRVLSFLEKTGTTATPSRSTLETFIGEGMDWMSRYRSDWMR